MSSLIIEIKVPNKHGGSHAHDCMVPVLGFGELGTYVIVWFGFMVFNTTFSNISAILWQ
jgi:hypothetical protein